MQLQMSLGRSHRCPTVLQCLVGTCPGDWLTMLLSKCAYVQTLNTHLVVSCCVIRSDVFLCPQTRVQSNRHSLSSAFSSLRSEVTPAAVCFFVDSKTQKVNTICPHKNIAFAVPKRKKGKKKKPNKTQLELHHRLKLLLARYIINNPICLALPAVSSVCTLNSHFISHIRLFVLLHSY